MLPSMLVRLPSVHPKQRRLAVGQPAVPSPVKSTGSGGGWCGLLSRHFLARGSSPFLNSSFPARFLNLPQFSRSVTLQTTLWVSILNGSRNIASRSEEHTSELQSQSNLVCRLLLE